MNRPSIRPTATERVAARPSRLVSGVASAAVCLVAAAALAVPQDSGTTAPPGTVAPPPTAPPVPPPPAAEPIDAKFTEADRSPEAIAKGKAALEALAKSYRSAKTLSDSATIEVVTPMGPQQESFQLDFAEGNDLRVKITKMTITLLKDTLYVEADQLSQEKYIGVPLLRTEQGAPDVAKTLEGVAEGFALPLPHLPFRFGGDEASYLKALSASALEDARIAGFRVDADKSQQILFKGANGTGVATLDPVTSLLGKVAVDFSPAGAPPGLGFTLVLNFNPVVADALKEPITFEPKGRKPVKTMDDLVAKLGVGEVAPLFALKTSGGEEVKLADLRDNVVVLDLWATWCGPCRRGLPLVNEFSQWAKENNKAVKVFGVNVWEGQAQALDPAARAQKVSDFWTKQNFSFPTLIDMDDKLANDYGPNGIPTTYVIGKDGKIAAIHTGFDPETKKKLQEDVERLLAQ